MPERPILILPSPIFLERLTRGRVVPARFHVPGHERQVGRIGPRLDALQRALRDEAVQLSSRPAGAVPEHVLVLETIGTPVDLMRAARRIPGLEWLGDLEEDEIEPDDDFYREDHPDRPVRRRLFLTMANQEAMGRIVSFWRQYQQDEDVRLPYGHARWKEVFRHLYRVRRWEPEDRLLETGLIDDWSARIEEGREVLPAEIELWYRHDGSRRALAQTEVSTLLTEVGGTVRTSCQIDEIHYHSLLAEVPIAEAERVLASRDTRLVRCQQVMFFRPVGQSLGIALEQDGLDPARPPESTPSGHPTVAILDGWPLPRHELLEDRLIVDDPDDYASGYQASEAAHGTTMASLVVHGDLNAGEPPLSRPVYVRPILQPLRFGGASHESIPESILPIDLVYKATKRMMEGEGEEDPAAPTVRILNLSVADPHNPFIRMMSPWARLLDWVSWHYRLLICVSSGNHMEPIEVPMPAGDFLALPSQDRQAVALRALSQDLRNRRLLSPSESINSLAVSAAHIDNAPHHSTRSIDVVDSACTMPSPISARGLGFRRSIKPDLMFPGGKVLFDEPTGNPTRLTPRAFTTPPGLRAAYPGRAPGELNATAYTCGTSGAAALASRAGARTLEVIEELGAQTGGEAIPEDSIAPLLKAMLVHGGNWAETGDAIVQALDEVPSRYRRDVIAAHIGFGLADPMRVLECTRQRATAVGAGTLERDQAHEYRLPLPPSLASQAIWRRVLVTLAWLTPVSSTHGKYRRAQLWVSSLGESLSSLEVHRTDAQWQSVQRGTVQHEVFEGHRASSFADGDDLAIVVNCREDAPGLEEAVPYGLAVSLEVAEGIEIPVYEEVQARIGVRVGITPRSIVGFPPSN